VDKARVHGMSDRRPELPHIEVDPDVAASARMPEDLDANVVAAYGIPDPVRRRRAALVYAGAAALVAVGIGFGLPAGMWLLVGALVVCAAYHVAAGWHLAVRDHDALDAANRATPFPVGHASAVVGFEGWRSRPVWNVLVFSADDPPSQHGLVRVDGVSGEVLGSYVEEVADSESREA
jgi:hypothetical protein